MKDHEIRELVNQLRDIAIKYHGTGQLRERIAHVVRAAMLQELQKSAGAEEICRSSEKVPDEMLCDFYEDNNWPDLVRELVKHVEQLQDSAKRNVKPWEDTFPETLLPAYIERIKQADEAWCAAMLTGSGVAVLVNDGTIGKPLTIILPDISSKAFWSGSGKTEVFHPEAYKRWVKEAIERHCAIARIDVEVK